jgi:hypothetical protein
VETLGDDGEISERKWLVALDPKPMMNLQYLIKILVLKGEELDNVVLPKEDVGNLRKGLRWMTVVKLHATKHFGN